MKTTQNKTTLELREPSDQSKERSHDAPLRGSSRFETTGPMDAEREYVPGRANSFAAKSRSDYWSMLWYFNGREVRGW